jgi:hypothetical protein
MRTEFSGGAFCLSGTTLTLLAVGSRLASAISRV